MSLPRCLTTAAVVVLTAVAVPGLSGANRAAASPSPRVSVISDSILTAVTWGDPSTLASLSAGLDLQIDAGVCRRLNGAELRVQRRLRADDPERDQQLEHPARLDRRDRRRLQRPAERVCRRRRAHSRHLARSRRAAHPLAEPARRVTRVRGQERRPRRCRAASSRATRARLEQLLREPSGLVPDRFHPSATRRRSCDRHVAPSSDRRHPCPAASTARRRPAALRSSCRKGWSATSAFASRVTCKPAVERRRSAGAQPASHSAGPASTCSRAAS